MKSLRKAIIEMRNDLVDGRSILPAFYEAKVGLTESDEELFLAMVGIYPAHILIKQFNAKIDQTSNYVVALILGDGEEVRTVYGYRKQEAFDCLVEYTRQGQKARLYTE